MTLPVLGSAQTFTYPCQECNNTFTGAGSNTFNGPVIFNSTLSSTTGFTAPAFISSSANPSVSGVLRVSSADAMSCFRNNANSADLCFTKNSGDVLNWPSAMTIAGTLGLAANSLTAGGYISSNANPATAGTFRLASSDIFKIRNNANGADLNLLSKNVSDVVAVGDVAGVSISGGLSLAGSSLTNTVFDTAAAGNIFKINGNTISSNTGSGSVNVLQTSPNLITPNIGLASGTSINLSGSAVVGTTLGVTGISTLASLLHTCDASTYAGANDGAKIIAALADSNCVTVDGSNLVSLSSTATITITANKHVILPCGLFVGGASVNPVFNIGNAAILRGVSEDCTIVSTQSGTADIIAVQAGGAWWNITDLAVRSEVARTAGSGIRLSGGNGIVERVTIYPVFNAISLDTANSSGGNTIRDVQITNGVGAPTAGSGGAWNCGVKVGGVPTGTVSGTVLDNVVISMSTAFTDAGFCIQDGADTTIVTGGQAVANLGGSDSVALHIEVVNGGNAPTATRFTGTTFEAGLTKNAVVIDSAANSGVEFIGVNANSSLRGYLISAGDGVHVIGGQAFLNQQEGIRVTGGTGLQVTGVRFSQNSQQTTNTFDDIFVAANLNQFDLIANVHKDSFSSGKVCKWGIEIAAGTSTNYSILGDINSSSCTTGAISDGGTGTAKQVCNPGAGCNIGLGDFLTLGNISANQGGSRVGFSGDLSTSRAANQGIVWFGSDATSYLDRGLTTAGHFTLNGALPLDLTGQLKSLVTTGTPPLIAASTTPVANLTTVPAAYDHTGAQLTAYHLVEDSCVLGTSCAVTLAGSAIYTSLTSYTCNCQDETAIASCKVAQASGSSFTVTGTGTDTIRYHCGGN